MLKNLWNRINNMGIKAEEKSRLFRIALEIPAGLAGMLLWLVIRTWCLGTPDWMLCFIGYPVMAAVFVSVFYSYNHTFVDRRPKTL